MIYPVIRSIRRNSFSIIASLFFMVIIIVIVSLSDGEKPDPVSNIADNLHLNIWDWLALVVSFLSFVFSVFTWHSQNETRKNTASMTREELRDMLVGYYHPFMRNVVNLYSLRIKLDETDWTYYPSEDYMWKMKLTEIDEKNISLKLVYGNRFYTLQSLNELIRFFNLNIDATVTHLKDSQISHHDKLRDIVNLTSMIWLIAQNFSVSIEKIFTEEPTGFINSKIRRFVVDSVTRWRVYNDVDDSIDYTVINEIDDCSFIERIFENNNDEKVNFLDKLKIAIIGHLSKSKNGFDRIPLIRIH